MIGQLLINGCKVGPDYKRPPVEIPTDWRWKSAEPKDQVPRGAWWDMFQDPALDAIQQKAVQGNLDLRIAFTRVEQARALARIDAADFYPSVTGGGTFTRYRTSGNSPSPVPFPIPSFTQQQWTVPFDLSYELDLWVGSADPFESAQQLALSAEAARQSILLSLQADVAATYFSLQTARRQIDFLTETIRLRQDALEIFQQRLQAGVGNDFEVQRGQVEVAAAQADLQNVLRRESELIKRLGPACRQAAGSCSVRGRDQPLQTAGYCTQSALFLVGTAARCCPGRARIGFAQCANRGCQGGLLPFPAAHGQWRTAQRRD